MEWILAPGDNTTVKSCTFSCWASAMIVLASTLYGTAPPPAKAFDICSESLWM